jgi:hypothetical protein
MHTRTLAWTLPALLALLAAPAFGQMAGGSTLHRLTLTGDDNEPSVGPMSQGIALQRLRLKGYTASGKLVRSGSAWVLVDAKTGKRVQIDALSGIVTLLPQK